MDKRQFDIICVIKSSSLLSRAFMYYTSHNIGINNPYHNLNHTLDLMALVNAYVIQNPYTEGEMENILLLAMFHDFNHSGGKFDDVVNVDNAISGLKDFMSTEGIHLCMDDEEAVRDTQYPYNGEPKTKTGAILRAADCLQWTFSDCVSQCIFGLISENGKMSVQKGICCYREFIKTLEPEVKRIAEYASIYDDNIDGFNDLCDNLSAIFGN